MPNRLANETSPYLLQHADNPVDWYPWGSEALSRAKREDKPVLLSVGYAACHWCHVMAHESFEDGDTARLMNEKFVNVKVDREERPDIDGIYMQAVQAMTGHGGWPMTVFLTPEGEPFYGGTYFPPDDRQGLPSFKRVLQSVADAYAARRDAVTKTAESLQAIYQHLEPQRDGGPSRHALELAFRSIAQQYDARNGGLGGAPKFPQTMALEFALAHWRRTGSELGLEVALESFRKMARGGIYDQIGGGFARYSVDSVWLVPHFEKMLYDNALLTRLGVHLWQATKDEEVRQVVTQTLEWVRLEMTSPAGGFFSSLDADSEGHEGKFYLWSEAELDSLLGDDAATVKAYYGVTASGNFEEANILHVAAPAEVVAARSRTTPKEVRDAVARARSVLYAARARRVWPGRDENILAAWNGLMLRAVAEAARAFQSDALTELALRNARFMLAELVRDGRVARLQSRHRQQTLGFLEDQAAVGLGLLETYALTFDPSWFARARELAERMLELYWDETSRIFYDTAHDAEKLITRPRDVTDNAVPAGNSLAAELLFRLAELTGEERFRAAGQHALGAPGEALARYPTAFGHLLVAADLSVNGGVQVALAGQPGSREFRALNRCLAESYVPALVLAGGDPSDSSAPPLLAGRPVQESATAFVCSGFTCDLPTRDPAIFTNQLEHAVRKGH